MRDEKLGKRIIGIDGEVFVINDREGGGAFGEVHKAIGEISKRIVAVKSLPIGVDSNGLEARAALNEARPEMTSIHHPNVVETLFVCDGTGSPIGPYIMNEYIDGGNLQTYLRTFVDRGEQVPIQTALQLIHEIALGAEAISHKLVHRDIKPDNILLQKTSNGLHPKISDFGIAKIAEAATRQSTETFKGIAPIAYRAPETFIKGAPNTGKIDTYSVGIAFYEVLTLSHPLSRFIPTNADISDWIHAHSKEIPDDPKLLRSEIPSVVGMLTLRMMSKLPAERPDWTEVLKILASSLKPTKPLRVSPQTLALFEQAANEIDKKNRERLRRQIADQEKKEKDQYELDNAKVIATKKLAEFDEYIAELSDARPDHAIKVIKSNGLERVWKLSNGVEICCAFWLIDSPLSTPRGRLVIGGFIGVDGGLSLNIALITTSDGTNHHWLSVKIKTHPMASEEQSLQVMREVGLSKRTIDFMQWDGLQNWWMREIPRHFGIPSSGRFFQLADNLGRQNMIDMSETRTDIDDSFANIVAFALRMSKE